MRRSLNLKLWGWLDDVKARGDRFVKMILIMGDQWILVCKIIKIFITRHGYRHRTVSRFYHKAWNGEKNSRNIMAGYRDEIHASFSHDL